MTGGPGRDARPAVRQLYYTSCEHGLSGFSGFQFNAVTPGLPAEVLHTVESLAGYDPPRPLVESDTREQLARCPVNLCFLPGGPDGRAATVVCVRYVGRDSARRFGNYFAHALHTEDFAAASGGLHGIDLWDSPLWTASVAAGTELPPLPGPPPRGPLTTGAVLAFLRAHPHAGQLPLLLAAVCGALADGRPVVLVDRTTDRIAHWFAAVSRLLPPPMVRQLSFATYQFRPERSRMHLTGAVPEVPLAFGPDEQDSRHVFDFAAGRFPVGLPVDGLAGLLGRIGVGSAGPVWSWTAEFTDGSERRPADWYAPVAAAAAGGGIPLAPEDLAAVIALLGDAARPAPRRAALARDLYLRHPALDEAQLTALSAAAQAGGDRDLHHELEGRLHASRMRAYVAGVPGAAGPVPVSDPAQRAQATALWLDTLAGAGDVRPRLRLLLWARGARLDLPPAAAEEACRALAAGLLGAAPARPWAAEIEEAVGRLADGWPQFRQSLLDEVAALPSVRDGRPDVFLRFPALLLTEADLGGHPELLEPFWTAAARREPHRAVPLLGRILARRGQDFPAPELLHALWPGPRPWTYEEARALLRALPAGDPPDGAADAARGWLDRTLQQEVTDREVLADCLRLCAQLSGPQRPDWPAGRTLDFAETTLQLARRLREAPEATALAREFEPASLARWAAPRALKRFRLVPAMLRLPADPAAVPAMLRRLDDRTCEAYLGAVLAAARERGPASPVLLSHVAGVALTPRERLPEARRALVVQVLVHAADGWRVADTVRLAGLVRPYDGELADELAARAGRRDSAPRRFLRQALRRRPPAGGAGSDGTPGRRPRKDEG
ncbi:hypothetical protein LG634_04605 [Streptomyces bambusae]|uniref:GTPase-associated protein 1-related protein n=1 Tax=Streptomyces bambusae TaxID=1550616 RepID=UPI001CFEF0A6|nr:GTPase-associated protein 1-related protein [Streptomyces bambusae]MCB5164116.1 hypothetical protein [Streptomyces bambusae]